MTDYISFFSLVWSSDWNAKHPWSVDGENLPWMGRRIQMHGKRDGQTDYFTFGPLLLIRIKMPSFVRRKRK